MTTAARWLDTKSLAKLMSIREDHIARYVKAGRLPKPVLSLGPRQPRWDREELEAFLVERALAAPTGNSVQADEGANQLPGRTATRQDRVNLMQIWDALGDASRQALLFTAIAMAKAERVSGR